MSKMPALRARFQSRVVNFLVLVGNALGALILLTAQVTQEPKGFVEAIALLAGPLALLVLLADETDEAWADLYSCAVSVQNVFPDVPLRGLVLGLGAVSCLIALLLDVTQYEPFLLLIGSVFVPLFGVLAADYFAIRGRYAADELARPPDRVSWRGALAWGLGVVTYLAIAGRFAPVLPGLPAVGASLPSLGVAWLAYLLLARRVRRPAEAAVA